MIKSVHASFAAIFAVACLGMTGCAKKAPFDERATFNASFSTPILVRVPTSNDVPGDFSKVAYPCILGQLFETKAISYYPDLSGPPWINVDIHDLPADRHSVVAFSGQRQFDSSSNIERYTRDSNDYFAETVSYYVNGSSPLDPPSSKGYGPYTSRVVYVRDPAVGEWRVETPASDDAEMDITRTMAGASCPKREMANQASKAYADAMNLAEQRLAGSGFIQKTPDSAVVFSKNGKIAIFKGWANDNKLDGVGRDVLTQTARSACKNLHRGKYAWRLPTFQDFYRFSMAGPREDYRRLQDTPQKRIWGDMVIAPNGSMPNYFVLDTNAPPYNLYEAVFRPDYITNDVITFSSGHPRLLCVADL